MEDLNAASLEDVKDWFRAYYGAANAVLVIAGDITVAEAKAEGGEVLRRHSRRPAYQRQQEWIAKMTGTRSAMMQDNVPQARIYKVWNIPGYQHRDFTLLDMTADVLGGGKNSRLYKRLVYTDRTATSVTAFMRPVRNRLAAADHRHGEAGQRSGGRGEGARRRSGALPRLRARRPRKLERIRTTNYANFARGIERIDGFGGKSSILAESQVYGGSPDFYKTRLGWIGSATPADVQGAAKRWLSDGVFVLNVRARAHVQDRGQHRGSQQAADARRAAIAQASRVPARAKLSNGLEIVVVERHSAPVVDFTLLADAGFAADAQAKPGTARLAMLMLQEGTKTRTSPEIAERAESLGAPLGRGLVTRSLVSQHECAQRPACRNRSICTRTCC